MTTTDFETAPTPMFDRVTVKHSDSCEKDIGGVTVYVPAAWIVYGGEYPEDVPDVLVTVNHAVDEDGGDISEVIARAIARALGGAA